MLVSCSKTELVKLRCSVEANSKVWTRSRASAGRGLEHSLWTALGTAEARRLNWACCRLFRTMTVPSTKWHFLLPITLSRTRHTLLSGLAINDLAFVSSLRMVCAGSCWTSIPVSLPQQHQFQQHRIMGDRVRARTPNLNSNASQNWFFVTEYFL